MLWQAFTLDLLASAQHCSTQQSSCCLAAGVVALPATSSFPGMASATGSSPGRKPTFFATGGEKGQLKIWQADSGELWLCESAVSLQVPPCDGPGTTARPGWQRHRALKVLHVHHTAAVGALGSVSLSTSESGTAQAQPAAHCRASAIPDCTALSLMSGLFSLPVPCCHQHAQCDSAAPPCAGQCVYEQAGMDLVQGGGITYLELLPKGAGLLVATADCRLLFFSQQVRPACCLASQELKACCSRPRSPAF